MQKQAEREKKRKERFYQRMRDKDFDRKEKMKIVGRQARILVFLAAVCCFVACAANWVLLLYYDAALIEPYETLIWVFAVVLSGFTVCSLCCVDCTITRSNIPVLFFVTIMFFFSFLCLFVTGMGWNVMSQNDGVKFKQESGFLKNAVMYAYLIGGCGGFVFLFGLGITGMQFDALSKENYFGRSTHVGWCPDFTPDFDKLAEDARKRQKKKLDDLPQSDMYNDDFVKYHQSFIGVLDLQQGRNEIDDVDFFNINDLASALPGVPPLDISGPISRDLTVDPQWQLKERPCKGRLLPTKQLRTEAFFLSVWGTALALALLRHKLSDWCEERAQAPLVAKGLTATAQLALFDRIVKETTLKLKAEWGQVRYPRSSETDSGAEGEEIALHIAEADMSEHPPAEASMDVNETVFWTRPIRKAVLFLNRAIFKQAAKNADIKSDARDWVDVGSILVKQWFAKLKILENKKS